MPKIFRITVLFAFVGFCNFITAQRSDDMYMTAGLAFRPIIPSGFLRTASVTTDGSVDQGNEYLELTINQKTGYSFGMIVRQNFTKRFAIETGINFVRRNLEVEVLDKDSGFVDTQTFGISAYEIPLTAMVFIKLGEQLHMNTSLGASLDIGARSVANGTERMDQYTAINKVVASAIANLGFEWRTKESGSIYLGATYHQPFGPIAETQVNYFRDPSFSDATIQSPVEGTYLTIDLRYYFHESAEGREARRKKRKKKSE